MSRVLLCCIIIFSCYITHPIFTNEEPRQMIFSARKAILAANDGVMELTGDVSIELITFNLQADKVEIRGSTYRTLKAIGAVTVSKATNNEETQLHQLTANQLHYNQQTKELRMWGEVVFFNEGDEVTISSTVLNYNEDSQEWRFEGDVQINGKSFAAQAIVAVFYEQTNQLELIGQATLVLTEDNQHFSAEQIHFNTVTEVLQMEHVNNGSINYNAATGS